MQDFKSVVEWGVIGLLLSLALVTSSVAVVAGFVHVHRVTDLVLPALAGIVAQTERVEEGVKAVLDLLRSRGAI